MIADALEQMIRRGDVSPRAHWQAIEFWAASHLAEVGAEYGAIDLARPDLTSPIGSAGQRVCLRPATIAVETCRFS
jgi:hypothetical protein